MTRRTIVITGASDGIGAAAARRIRRSGAEVVLAGRSETKELHRRYRSDRLSAVVVNPGFVNTNIGHASRSRFLTTMQRTPVSRMIRTADHGADQLVWLATSSPGIDWVPGEYYSNAKISKVNRTADDPAIAGELWDRIVSTIGWQLYAASRKAL